MFSFRVPTTFAKQIFALPKESEATSSLIGTNHDVSRTTISPSSLLDADVDMEDTAEVPEPSTARLDTRTSFFWGSDTVANPDLGNGGAHSSDIVIGAVSEQSDLSLCRTPPPTVVPTRVVIRAHREITPADAGPSSAPPPSTSFGNNPLNAGPHSLPTVQANRPPGTTGGEPPEKGIPVTGIPLGGTVGPPLGTVEHPTICDQPSSTLLNVDSSPGLHRFYRSGILFTL